MEGQNNNNNNNTNNYNNGGLVARGSESLDSSNQPRHSGTGENDTLPQHECCGGQKQQPNLNAGGWGEGLHQGLFLLLVRHVVFVCGKFFCLVDLLSYGSLFFFLPSMDFPFF